MKQVFQWLRHKTKATAEGQEARNYIVIQCWRSKEMCVCFVFGLYLDLHATVPFLYGLHHSCDSYIKGLIAGSLQ